MVLNMSLSSNGSGCFRLVKKNRVCIASLWCEGLQLQCRESHLSPVRVLMGHIFYFIYFKPKSYLMLLPIMSIIIDNKLRNSEGALAALHEAGNVLNYGDYFALLFSPWVQRTAENRLKGRPRARVGDPCYSRC